MSEDTLKPIEIHFESDVDIDTVLKALHDAGFMITVRRWRNKAAAHFLLTKMQLKDEEVNP
jgi:hypothetical protein